MHGSKFLWFLLLFLFAVFLLMFGVLRLLTSVSDKHTSLSTSALATENNFFSSSYIRQAKQNLMYFQDDRTGICFAFTWAGASTGIIGGPAVVDCEKIPSDLLR